MRSFARDRSPPIFLQARRAHLKFGEPAPAHEDLALAALWYATREADAAALWADTTGWRLGAAAASNWRFGAAHREDRIDRRENLSSSPRGSRLSRFASWRAMIRRSRWKSRDGSSASPCIESGRDLELFRGGRHVRSRWRAPRTPCRPITQEDAGSLLTPLPGTVVAVHVSAGQSGGARRAALDDRSDENGTHVTAPYAGTIEHLPFGVGGPRRGRRDAGRAVAALARELEPRVSAPRSGCDASTSPAAKGGQADLEARLVAEQARESNFAAGLVHVAPNQGHARAVRSVARGTREGRVARFENEFDRLSVAQPRGRFAVIRLVRRPLRAPDRDRGRSRHLRRAARNPGRAAS